jgi:hypothetical protein
MVATVRGEERAEGAGAGDQSDRGDTSAVSLTGAGLLDQRIDLAPRCSSPVNERWSTASGHARWVTIATVRREERADGPCCRDQDGRENSQPAPPLMHAGVLDQRIDFALGRLRSLLKGRGHCSRRPDP